MRESSTNKIAAFLAAFLLSMLFWFAGLKVEAVSDFLAARGNQNLLLYGSFIILFCFLFFAFYGLLTWLHKGQEKPGSIIAYISVLLCLVFDLVFLWIMMVDEGNIFGGVTDRYAWHRMPPWLVLFGLVALVWFFFICLRNMTIRRSGLAPWIIYALLGMLNLYNFYTPAIFKDGESGRLHIDAYYNSIYMVLHGSPYSDNMNSIYGHYGIFYRLPLKILGGSLNDFVLINAALLALSMVLMFLALHMLVENNLLRVLGAVAMSFPTLTMRGGAYWQLWPHRILFMSISIFFMALLVRFRIANRFTMILTYLISVLAIVWNTESGVFCAMGFAAFWILRSLCRKKWTLAGVIGTFVGNFALVAAAFMGAWGLVDLYNLCHGGQLLALKTFVFPIFSGNYMNDELRVDLTTFPSAYMAIMLLLCIGLAWGISRMYIFQRGQQLSEANIYRACIVFGTAVLTLGQISYYINRAAYHNLDIGHLPSILLMCMAAQSGMKMVKEGKLREWKSYTAGDLYHGLLSAVCMGVIFIVCMGTLIQYGYNISYKQEFHDKQEMNNFATELAASIPTNTYGFGIGVPELYAVLGWDTQIYCSDFADASVYPPMTDYVLNDIKEKMPEGVLVGEGTIRRLEEDSSDQNAWFEAHYQLQQSFTFEDATLEYYEIID